MSQTTTQTPERSAKELASAFFSVADEIEAAQRLPTILMAVSQIVARATT